jgi:predicted MarR family transcription regulator
LALAVAGCFVSEYPVAMASKAGMLGNAVCFAASRQNSQTPIKAKRVHAVSVQNNLAIIRDLTSVYYQEDLDGCCYVQ